MYKRLLLQATKLLYPTGKAFKLFDNNNIGKLHKALAESENRVLNDIFSTYDEVLPDNFNFTSEVASQWERRLGLTVNPNITLQQRKLAIKRKMNHPGDIPGRQNIRYIEQQIQDAGFTNLYVHKNKFNGVARSPREILGSRHGNSVHGGTSHGGYFGEVVIDYLEPKIDEQRYFDYIWSKPSGFDLEPFYRMTFFIADSNLDFATVDANRRRELRALILKLMPANMICFLITKYS